MLENDASEYGLGFAMMQEGKSVVNRAERCLAQIEKDAERDVRADPSSTTTGEVEVVTDHKPLVPIQAKPLGKASVLTTHALNILIILLYACVQAWKPNNKLQ